MNIKKLLTTLITSIFLCSSLFAQKNSLNERLYKFSPKKKINKLLKVYSTNKQEYFLSASSVISEHFNSAADKNYLKTNLKNLPLEKPYPKISISKDVNNITITYDGGKISLANFNNANKSFSVNGTKVVIQGLSLESAVDKIILAINSSTSKNTFMNFFIGEAHAVIGVLLVVLTIIVVLPFTLQAMLISGLKDSLDDAIKECENRDNTPYRESKTYEVIEKLSVEWGVSFGEQKDFDCTNFSKMKSKRKTALSAKKILEICQKNRELTRCINKYKKDYTPIKNYVKKNKASIRRAIDNSPRHIVPDKGQSHYKGRLIQGSSDASK